MITIYVIFFCLPRLSLSFVLQLEKDKVFVGAFFLGFCYFWISGFFNARQKANSANLSLCYSLSLTVPRQPVFSFYFSVFSLLFYQNIQDFSLHFVGELERRYIYWILSGNLPGHNWKLKSGDRNSDGHKAHHRTSKKKFSFVQLMTIKINT